MCCFLCSAEICKISRIHLETFKYPCSGDDNMSMYDSLEESELTVHTSTCDSKIEVVGNFYTEVIVIEQDYLLNLDKWV